jgi:hypothetical protein
LLAIGSPIYLGANDPSTVPLVEVLFHPRQAAAGVSLNLPGRPPFLRSAARTQQTIGMATKNKAAALLLCFLFLAAIVSAEVCMLHW